MLTVREQQSIRDLREAQRQVKERLRRLKVFAASRDTEFWEALKSELDFNVKTRETAKEVRERGNPADDPVKEWAYGRADRAVIDAYQGIKGVVDQAELRVEKMNEDHRRYGELARQIEDAAKNRGAQRKTAPREEV